MDWFDKGNALFKSGHYEDAVLSYDRALEIKPNDYQALNNRGNALDELGCHDEAIAAYDRALQIKPDYYLALFNRGVLLRKLGRYDEAIAAYDRALQIKPDYYLAWNDKGVVLRQLGRHDEGITAYDRALQIKPDYHLALFNRGNALNDLCRHDEAIAAYDCALQIKPDYYLAWSNRGLALNKLGRHDEAIAAYDRALQIKSNYYLAWLNRSTAICNLSTKKLSSNSLMSVIQKRSIWALQQSEPHTAALKEALPNLTEHSADWARIHLAIGDACLKHSIYKENPLPYWRDAARSYQEAYPILSVQDFPEDRLGVLQGLIRVYLALEDIPTARRFQQEGMQLFEQLRSIKAASLRAAFERKFVSFAQLEIDLLVGDQNSVAALEQAEFYKNRCLTWILDSWQDSPKSPSYSKVKQLVDAQTAIVYWHLSVDSLTTFLLTADQDEPIVINTNRRQQAQQLRQWLGTYLSQYRSYASQKPKGAAEHTEFGDDIKPNEHLTNHPWRKSLSTQIEKLRSILQIDTISRQLPDTVNRLILVPHRDLHCVPLQPLFADRFTCTFLPSLQVGLQLQQAGHSSIEISPLLNVGDPKTDQLEMRFAGIESAVIQQLVKDSVLIERNAASLETIKAALRSPYKAFHFNGHGAYNAAKPSDSALGLTNGLFSAKQINQLDLKNYQLICLAACETALTGKEGIPDEYVGLASAFLKAGASNVLSTLWPIDEVTSAWIVIRFYQGLLAGKTPAVALKAAQTWMKTISKNTLADWIIQLSQLPGLADGPRDCLKVHARNLQKKEGGTMEPPNQATDHSHPYYWAAFTLTGWG